MKYFDDLLCQYGIGCCIKFTKPVIELKRGSDGTEFVTFQSLSPSTRGIDRSGGCMTNTYNDPVSLIGCGPVQSSFLIQFRCEIDDIF